MCIQLENGALVTCTLRTMKKHHVWTNDSVVFEARHCDLHHGPRGVRHDMRLHGLGTTITKQRSSSDCVMSTSFPTRGSWRMCFPTRGSWRMCFPTREQKCTCTGKSVRSMQKSEHNRKTIKRKKSEQATEKVYARCRKVNTTRRRCTRGGRVSQNTFACIGIFLQGP